MIGLTCLSLLGSASVFSGVVFSRDYLGTVLFIIAAIFEAESDGAGKPETCRNVRCSRVPNRHGYWFHSYPRSLDRAEGDSVFHSLKQPLLKKMRDEQNAKESIASLNKGAIVFSKQQFHDIIRVTVNNLTKK
jgi:hypothetical protein